MHTPLVTSRRRYPLRAKLAVAGAVLFFLAELVVLSLCMLPLLPLAPAFILIMLGNGFVLADVVQWAASPAFAEPVRVERAETAGKIGDARSAQAAHAV